MRLLPLLLLGCMNATPPDFRDGLGVSVYLDGHARAMSPEASEAIGDALIRRWPLGGEGELRACAGRATVILTNQPFACPDGRGLCAGEQNHDILTVAAMTCPYRGALGHELAHWFQECAEGKIDYDHTETPVWDAVAAVHQELEAACEP